MASTHRAYIGGKWVDSSSGETYETFNPAHTSRVVGTFQACNLADTQDAIDTAKAAAAGWANTPAPQRGSILLKALAIMERRAEELARAITVEEGKPIIDSRGEIKRAMNIIEYSAGEGRRMFGYTTPSELPDTVAYTIRRPIGVVAIITPWNFPVAIPAWKIAPALICGNAVIFKPASSTPFAATLLTEVFEEAGIPPGVLNLVTGSGSSVGNALVESPDVTAISFTGHQRQLQDFIKSIRTGSKPLVDGEQGRKSVEIILSIYKAAWTGRRVQLPLKSDPKPPK